MNRSYSKKRHIQESNLILENRRRFLFEQSPTGGTPSDSSSSVNPLRIEAESLESLNKELKNTLKNLKTQKRIDHGTVLSRINDFLKIKRLTKKNNKLQGQIENVKDDMEQLEKGKILTDEQKFNLTSTIEAILIDLGILGGIAVGDAIKNKRNPSED